MIDVGNLQGTVRKISVRATTVETPDNAIIFVPNSEFVSNRLINWTRNERHVRRDLAIGVAYGTDRRLNRHTIPTERGRNALRPLSDPP